MTHVSPGQGSSKVGFDVVQPNQRFVEICWRLGMKQEAPFGWAQLHVKPHVICMAYIFSIAGVLTTTSVLYGVGLSWLNYYMHFPYIVAMVSLICCTTLVWRCGPSIVKSKAYKSALGLFSTTAAFLQVMSFVGPDSCTPFSNRVVTIFGTAITMFPGFCFALFGGGEAEHPPQPYDSLWGPLLNAAFSTMRFIDAMTDMGFVHILLVQGQTCVWYGAAVPCSFYTRLAVAAATFALTNFTLMAIAASLGGQTILFGGRHHRLKAAMALNTTVMLFEVAGIAIALLKVFSDMQLPGGSARSLRINAAYAIISCCCTMVTFCTNMVGMHKLLQLMRSGTRNVQHVASLILFKAASLSKPSIIPVHSSSLNTLPSPLPQRTTMLVAEVPHATAETLNCISLKM